MYQNDKFHVKVLFLVCVEEPGISISLLKSAIGAVIYGSECVKKP